MRLWAFLRGFMPGTIWLLLYRRIVQHPTVASRKSLQRDSRLVARAWEVSFTLCKNDSSLCILLWLQSKTSSPTRFGQHIATSLLVCIFISVLGLACPGAGVSVSFDSYELSIQKGILMLLPSRLRGHGIQYNVFERVGNCGFDVSLGFLTYSRSQKVDWSLQPSITIGKI